MKDTGEPEHEGEALHQAGATAMAVEDETTGELVWDVRRHSDHRIRRTKKLGHMDHWEPRHRWEVPAR